MSPNLFLLILFLMTTSSSKLHIQSTGPLINVVVNEPNNPLRRQLSENTKLTLTDEDKLSILNHHNYYRNLTASGRVPNHPPSTNMNKVHWDNGLAQIAANYASKCNHYHNNHRISDLHQIRNIVSWKYDAADITIGESLYIGKHDNLLDAALHGIDLFFEENEFYNFATSECDEYARWETCDHFKQLVYAQTRYVGCGIHKCDVITIGGIDYPNVINFVCNYFPSFTPNQKPYKHPSENDNNYDDNDIIFCSQCDEDRICGNEINDEYNALCAGCMAEAYLYCQDSSDVCQDFKHECAVSSTLQSMCRTSCQTCLKAGINGFAAPNCCTNGIDDRLKCFNASVADQAYQCKATVGGDESVCNFLANEIDCCADEYCVWNETECEERNEHKTRIVIGDDSDLLIDDSLDSIATNEEKGSAEIPVSIVSTAHFSKGVRVTGKVLTTEIMHDDPLDNGSMDWMDIHFFVSFYLISLIIFI